MTRNIKWNKKAKKDYRIWKDKNPKMINRIWKLIDSIDKDGPVKGPGNPEKLLNRKEFSRRITDWDRLIYLINGNDIIIISCKDHQGWGFKKGRNI